MRRATQPVLLLLFGLSSCGMMLSPSRYRVPVASDPPGAAVFYRGKQVGRTPCEVDVGRDDLDLWLCKDGFHDRRVDVGSVPNYWVGANALNGGIGFPFDLAFGADRNPDVAPVEVELSPSSDTAFGPWSREPMPLASTEGGAGVLDREVVAAMGRWAVEALVRTAVHCLLRQ